MSCTVCPVDPCTVETNTITFRIGYPIKDNQGNAIDVPEGIQLEVQEPGTNEFVVAGSCDFPQDTIVWPCGPDGKYIFRARGFMYKVTKGGKRFCKRFGQATANIGVLVKDARPSTPPDPVEIIDCCGVSVG